MYHKLRKVVFLCLVLSLLLGCSSKEVEYISSNKEDASVMSHHQLEKENSNPIREETNSQVDEIFVHVTGAVAKEGMVKVSTSARVFDCIEAAGGLIDGADLSSVNMAMKVKDELHIHVRLLGEKDFQGGEEKISINEASIETLMTLPGIGQSKALAIDNYRNSVGRFQSIEELMQIEGIKEGLFLKIKDKITL